MTQIGAGKIAATQIASPQVAAALALPRLGVGLRFDRGHDLVQLIVIDKILAGQREPVEIPRK